MSKIDNTTDDRSRINQLEQRIDILEEENERIKTQLDQQGSKLPNVTRRQALAGIVGGSALFGTAGAANAQSKGDNDSDPPWASDGHDHNGKYGTAACLGEATPVESITARTFHDQPYVQNKDDGIVDRDIVSVRPIQIWVDPNGDDSAAGTEEEPVASLQEALNRLPYILAHPVDIVLASGTAENPMVHDTDVSVISGILRWCTPVNRRARPTSTARQG